MIQRRLYGFLFILSFFVGMIVNAEDTSSSDFETSEIREILAKQQVGYVAMTPDLQDQMKCVQAIETIRSHHFKAFATATGAGLGAYLYAKAKIKADLNFYSTRLTEYDAQLNSITRQSAREMNIAYELEKKISQSSEFEKNIIKLEQWVESLDPKSPELKTLKTNIETLKSKMKSLKAGEIAIKENSKVVIQLLRYPEVHKKSLTKMSETERKQLLNQARQSLSSEIERNQIRLKEVSDFIKNEMQPKIFRVGKASFNIKNGPLQLVSETGHSGIATLKRVPLKNGIFFFAALGVPLDAAMTLYNAKEMTNESVKNLTQEETILNEQTKPRFICSTIQSSNDENKKSFQETMSLLLTAVGIDKGTAVKQATPGVTQKATQ